MGIRAVKHSSFKVTNAMFGVMIDDHKSKKPQEPPDGDAGDRFLGWKVYINGKKYPLGKGNYYVSDNNEEGKQHAIDQATRDILDSILPNYGWVTKDVSKMNDYEWEEYNDDRKNAFYRAGNKFKPSKTCSMCDHYNDYICLEHEILQLDKEGFL